VKTSDSRSPFGLTQLSWTISGFSALRFCEKLKAMIDCCINYWTTLILTTDAVSPDFGTGKLIKT
jgi:hypothetical protein